MKWLYETAGWVSRRAAGRPPRTRRPRASISCRPEPLEGRQLLSAVADATFGVNGRATYDAVGLLDEALNIAALSDGRLLAAGQVNVPATDPVTGANVDGRGILMRIKADGSLDRAFGDNGFAIPRAENGNDFPVDQFNAVTVQSDGKILVAGSAFSKKRGGSDDNSGGGDDNQSEGSAAFAVARYNTDGTPDESFGDHGVTLVDFSGSADVAYALSVQPDGKIVAAGAAAMNPLGDRGAFAAVRLDADGKVDKDFGRDGLATADFGGTSLAGRDEAHTITLQTDGSILLGGTSAGTAGAGPGSDGFGLVRLTAAGAIDPNFGEGGFRFTRLPGTINLDGAEPTTVTQIIVQPDGRLLAGGTIAGGRQFRVVRYTADGSPDATFGDGGLASTPAAALGRFVMRLGDDGALTVAGIDASSNGPGQLAFFRTSAAGQLVDSDGPAVADAVGTGGPGFEQMDALAFSEGGKLIAAGRSAAAPYAGEGEGWIQTNDALVRRFTLPERFGGPVQQTPQPPTPVPPNPLPPTPVPDPDPPVVPQELPPDFSGSRLVKSGNQYKFDLIFLSEASARGAATYVVGPNGFSQAAVVTKTKTKKNKKTGASLTTVSYRVSAPGGGKFEAEDNGTYQILLPPKSGASADAQAQEVASFQVQVKSKKPKGRSRSEESGSSLLTPAQVKDLKAKGWTTFKWRGNQYIAKAGVGIYLIGAA